MKCYPSDFWDNIFSYHRFIYFQFHSDIMKEDKLNNYKGIGEQTYEEVDV